MTANAAGHRVVVIGGGNAGISLAAHLRRAGMNDVAVIEPAESHFSQPLWTLVGGARATAAGRSVRYHHLVVSPGIQQDGAAVPGMAESLHTAAVSSNYRCDLAPKTWQLITTMRSGTAIFTMPSGPIKCAGAPPT